MNGLYLLVDLVFFALLIALIWAFVKFIVE